MKEFSRLVLEHHRADGLRAVQVPLELAPLLDAWVASKHTVDPVEFLREQLRKLRLPPPVLG